MLVYPDFIMSPMLVTVQRARLGPILKSPDRLLSVSAAPGSEPTVSPKALRLLYDVHIGFPVCVSERRACCVCRSCKKNKIDYTSKESFATTTSSLSSFRS